MIRYKDDAIENFKSVLHFQGHQEEVSQKVLKEATTEKRVKVKAMCKIEWFDDSGTTVLQPVSSTRWISTVKILQNA